MKKSINLQLFADDAADNTAVSATDAKPTETTTVDKEPVRETKAEPKYTDADVDKLIERKFAEWQKKQQKAVAEAEKLAEMNAQQKAEYERDQLKKELDALRRKESISEMTKTARKMFADKDIPISDDVLSLLVTTDAQQTKTAVDSFIKLYSDAVEKAVKERLKGEPPRKGSGGVGSMTKEQIMSIKDPELRQKAMLANKHLFNF